MVLYCFVWDAVAVVAAVAMVTATTWSDKMGRRGYLFAHQRLRYSRIPVNGKPTLFISIDIGQWCVWLASWVYS